MSVSTKTMAGIAWAATSGAVQFIVRLTTFSLVASQLEPSQIGAFGVAAFSIGFMEVLTARPFGEALQQRPILRRAHLTATFWCVLGATCFATISLIAFSTQVAEIFSAPLASALLACLALTLPLNAISEINQALLMRKLKFDVLSRVGAIGSVISGAAAITAIMLGAGVWSLIISDLAGRVYRVVHIWSLTRFIPGSPTAIGAIRDLAKFNLNSLGIYLLGFLDGRAPQILTGFLLGPTALGYLVIAERAMGLIKKLVLGPIASVTLVSVSRVQRNRTELKTLVKSLYRVASCVGYPAFLGFIAVIPDLANLIGDKWVPAILAAQILACRGLRITTSILNVAILRGVGRTGAPLILLGLGVFLKVLLIPIFSVFGIVGIACAMLARSLLVWPIGLHLIKRATGISIWEQLLAGAGFFLAAATMFLGITWHLSNYSSDSHVERLISATLVGLLIYVIVIFLLNWRTLVSSVRLLLAGEQLSTVYNLWLGLETKLDHDRPRRNIHSSVHPS